MKKTDKKQIKLNYNTSVAVLPATVASYIDKAKKFDLKVLFLLASHDSLREGGYAEKLAKMLAGKIKFFLYCPPSLV